MFIAIASLLRRAYYDCRAARVVYLTLALIHRFLNSAIASSRLGE
jgi:hypothetical protein